MKQYIRLTARTITYKKRPTVKVNKCPTLYIPETYNGQTHAMYS